MIDDGFNFRNGEFEMVVSLQGRFGQQAVGFNKCIHSAADFCLFVLLTATPLAPRIVLGTE